MNAIAIASIVVAVLMFVGGVIGVIVATMNRLGDARVAEVRAQLKAAVEVANAYKAKAAAAENAADDVIADNADYEAAKAAAAKAAADQMDLASVVAGINGVLSQPLAGASAASDAGAANVASVPETGTAAAAARFKRPLRK